MNLTFASTLPDIHVLVTYAYFFSFQLGVEDNDKLHAGDFVVLGAGVDSGTLLARQWRSNHRPSLLWFFDADVHTSHLVPKVAVLQGAAGAHCPPVPPLMPDASLEQLSSVSMQVHLRPFVPCAAF